MKVTSVKIFRPEGLKGRLKAFATVIIDDALVVHGVQVLQGRKKTYISMPTRKNKEGKFVNIAHPIKEEVRSLIEKEVVNAYKNRG